MDAHFRGHDIFFLKLSQHPGVVFIAIGSEQEYINTSLHIDDIAGLFGQADTLIVTFL